MKYRIKVITSLGTFVGKDTADLTDEQLTALKSELMQPDVSGRYISTQQGEIIFGSKLAENSIIVIEAI